MKLVKYVHRTDEPLIGLWQDDVIFPIPLAGQYRSLSELLEAPDPAAEVEFMVDRQGESVPLAEATLLAPIDQQEIWAAGVTYRRSRVARMEESPTAATCYDRVYTAPRPELFFKATPNRVSGPGVAVRIRQDSHWNVPEPELTLVCNSRLDLVGFTVGNDMSSRDIEGENPLYLPQAKLYNASAAVGPCITLRAYMPSPEQIGIQLVIRRHGAVAFQGTTSAGNLARTYSELIGWLGRDNVFPSGVMLMTGTGIVPENDFTLLPGDVVEISIEGIGTLTNPVVQG